MPYLYGCYQQMQPVLRPKLLAGKPVVYKTTQPDTRVTLGYFFTVKRVLTNLITHFRLNVATIWSRRSRIYVK
jgi:hypothetical protein